MPHTNRIERASAATHGEQRKIDFSHSNRKIIQGESGWSQVINVRSRKGFGRNGQTSTNYRTPVAAPLVVGNITFYHYEESSMAKLHQDLKYFTKLWDEDRASLELHNILLDSDFGVTNVVCLALGSLHNGVHETKVASMMQLVALRSMIETLQIKGPIVFQEPMFSALDKQFLNCFGYEVVENPYAWERINSGSLVHSIHCYNRVTRYAIDDSRPAMMVRNALVIHPWDEGVQGPLEYHEALKGDYVETAHPQLQHGYAFADTKIYWRKELSTPVLCVDLNK